MPSVAAIATTTPTQVLRPTATPEPSDALMSALPSGATEPPIASGTPRPRSILSPEQLPHADADLEALLPTQIGDVPLFRLSALGRDFSGGGDMCSFVCPMEPRLMADGVGATVDDIRLAVAVDPSGQQYLLVAWHVDGATGAELRDARIGMLDSEPPYPLVKDFDVAGRVVTVAVRSWFPNDTQFLVMRRDALIVIQYPTEIHDSWQVELPDGVAEIVAALP